jgi:hypothetical protein
MRAEHLLPLLALLISAGCATTRYTDTSRTAMEQLLISNAVDQALDRVEFPQLAGQSVFIEDKYVECVDKAYVVACVRHRVLSSGAKLADKADSADLVLEVRSGGVGTDKVETFFGVPKIALPGPMPISLPEVKLVGRETQSGTAKLGVVAYHAKEKRAVGEGGLALAKSQDNGWTILGMGPYFSGDVREEVTSATTSTSVSSDTAHTAAKRGYRTVQGKLANVTLSDGRAATFAAAAPASAAAPAVADVRGQLGAPVVRPASVARPSAPPVPSPAAIPGGSPLGPYPMTPQPGMSPSASPRPGGGVLPPIPSPGTMGGF